MKKDPVKGQVEQVKGQAKEATGKIFFGYRTLENKGKIQNKAGKVQEAHGDDKEDLKKG